ncbi:MAG: hypothetical protein ACOZAI_05060 [Pseudomonadota bacterium]
MTAPAPAPAWFRQSIGRGLQQLVCLSLPGQPPAETIALTKEAWINTLWTARRWQETELERLMEAFRLLARRCDRWPAPRAILDHLPPPRAVRALPKPRTEAMRQAGLQALQDLRNKLRGCA